MVKCIRTYVENDREKYIEGEVYLDHNKSIDRVVVLTDKGYGKSFSYDEMKKFFVRLSEEEEFELLRQAAQPMINYLNKFCDPMTTAVITEGHVKIVVEEKGIPLEVRN